MEILESEDMLKNMWPLVQEISQVMANESRGNYLSFI